MRSLSCFHRVLLTHLADERTRLHSLLLLFFLKTFPEYKTKRGGRGGSNSIEWPSVFLLRLLQRISQVGRSLVKFPPQRESGHSLRLRPWHNHFLHPKLEELNHHCAVAVLDSRHSFVWSLVCCVDTRKQHNNLSFYERDAVLRIWQTSFYSCKKLPSEYSYTVIGVKIIMTI